jgi:type IV pilus assembly protein PilA
MRHRTQTRNRTRRGFSLIELLIVVAIILIIAAIAMPNLLKSRMAANEASSVASLRTLNTAMITYVSQCPTIGFPATLADLGPSAPSGCLGGANILDNVLGVAAPTKSGYNFTYAAMSSGGGYNDSYTVNADPINRGTTGQRSFFTNPSGVVRFNQLAASVVTDPPIQ